MFQNIVLTQKLLISYLNEFDLIYFVFFNRECNMFTHKISSRGSFSVCNELID